MVKDPLKIKVYKFEFWKNPRLLRLKVPLKIKDEKNSVHIHVYKGSIKFTFVHVKTHVF